MDQDSQPILTAVSSSARQLFLLLRCIAFSNKAHVTISEEGLKISVDEVSAMEGTLRLNSFTQWQNLTRSNSINLPQQVSLHNLQLPDPSTTAWRATLRQ